MTATPRHRAHFAAIARAKDDEKRDQIARAARSIDAEGIIVGFELALLFPPSDEVRPLEDERAFAQIELRRRWLARKPSAA